MSENIKTVNSFYIYSNTFAIMDSFNVIWKIGRKIEMIDNCNNMNKDEALSFYVPFSVVQLTESTSVLYISKEKVLL